MFFILIASCGSLFHFVDSNRGIPGWTVGELFRPNFDEERRKQSEAKVRKFWQSYLTEAEGEVPEDVLGKNVELTLTITRVDALVRYGKNESSNFPHQHRIEAKFGSKLWVLVKDYDPNSRQPNVGDEIKVYLCLDASMFGDGYVNYTDISIL
jgi:hypothetical protein